MAQQSNAPDLAEQISERLIRHSIERESAVTKTDVAVLDGKIERVHQRVGYLMAMVGLVLALLIATYGGLAWFTWRLADALIG